MNLGQFRKIKIYIDSREAERIRNIRRSKIINDIECMGNSNLSSFEKRSISQYRLLRKYQSCIYKMIYDAFSITLGLYLRLKGCFTQKRPKHILSNDKHRAVFLGSSTNKSIIPKEIERSYVIYCEPFLKNKFFSKDVLIYWKRSTKKMRFHAFYRTQSLIYLTNIAYSIERYSPEALITTSESSFVCSLITEYCHLKNVKHICIMHGEKLIQPGTAFFKVDSFFVWDKYYVDLFQACKADVGKFVISNPWQRKTLSISSKTATYYMQILPKDMRGFTERLYKLSEKGWTVKVRPHPSFMNDRTLRKYFRKEQIEDSNKVDIEESLDSTTLAISQYSTSLFQAWSRGVKVCIDDVSNVTLFRDLQDKKYIMLQKDHILLSQLIG